LPAGLTPHTISGVTDPGASRISHPLAACALLLFACHSNAVDAVDPGAGPAESIEAQGPNGVAAPTAVQPPFAVQGELDGLLMVWFDGEGVHTAQKRSEIPEAHRAQVRIDSLNVAPDARLDADHVYVADVRTAGQDGTYPVKKATRGWFDAQVDRAKPQVAANSAGVVMYKASWCGVCRSAAAYLRARHIDFVEKDVEKDPGASDEMLRKAREKGLTPRGVPVIDFRGEIMLGFDQARVQALIDRYAKAI
jgi:glutaredoxin